MSITVEEAIVSVAESALKSNQEFRTLAKEMADEVGVDSISIIPTFLHKPPTKPEHLNDVCNGLGDWLAVCQFAAFELLYNLGHEALPTIREVAFGVYDWTQGNALEVLVRLAADGVQREQIIKELNEEMSDIRYEALYYAAEPLIAQSESNPKINEILEQIKVGQFQRVIEKIRKEYK